MSIPNLRYSDGLTARFGDDDTATGRPQSPIRDWFIPMYINDKLKDGERKKLKNISGYICPQRCCKQLIAGTDLKNLCRHVLVCPGFDAHLKGLYPISHNLYFSFLYMLYHILYSFLYEKVFVYFITQTL